MANGRYLFNEVFATESGGNVNAAAGRGLQWTDMGRGVHVHVNSGLTCAITSLVFSSLPANCRHLQLPELPVNQSFILQAAVDQNQLHKMVEDGTNFGALLSCYWNHLQNKTVTYQQAHAACSAYEDAFELGTGLAIFYGLTGILIIAANISLLLGIICRRELHKPRFLYISNLAMADLLADSYLAVRHPIFFHIHADSATLRALVPMAALWIVLCLFAFSPNMGWNCLDMQAIATDSANCPPYVYHPVAFVISFALIMLVFCSIMAFTNFSVLLKIRERRKTRLGQAGAMSENNPGPSGEGGGRSGEGGGQPVVQDEANRKFERSVHKARTVMLLVAMAMVLWLLLLLTVPMFCIIRKDLCPVGKGEEVFVCLNSLINPIATLIRTPDLRREIWRRLTAVRQVLVAVIRGNSVNPQEDQTGTGDATNLQEGPAHGEGQNSNTNSAPNKQPGMRNFEIYGLRRILHDQATVGQERYFYKRQAENLAVVETD
uniref:G-protein coupled receptors family 1 profile domain-containing protein n=1 Tax=Branchiostoma floridae TaxID=7739 RepID=C3ZQ84_BRAFL|eukprot:XP_002589452.1 hypothetical protein BRAFLDRAFT_80153 [Branchiostoma floridae]